VEFFSESRHPEYLQEITVDESAPHHRVPDEGIEQFIAAKVYWLAFRQHDKSASVWVADPWDASYLGVSTRQLIQASQIGDARGLIELIQDGHFARASDRLIVEFQPQPSRQKQKIGFV